MLKEQFKLDTYIPYVIEMAEANHCSNTTALGYFIVNLTTMKEHYAGASDLNFHELGQRWNSLTSKEKVAQKDYTGTQLAQYSRRGGRV